MYCHDLVRFAYYYVHDVSIAEDIVQDVFLTLWKKRSKFKSQNHLQAYLYKVTKNAALMVLRKRKIRQKFKNEQTEELAKSPADEFFESDLDKVYHHAIFTLPEKCRVIFCMSRIDGLTYKEIAQTLGISIKTVETQIGRALVTLRKRLSAYLT
jgi:RNA polymerase sigma-70 factor (ECF subfamily)